jgi:hypothetical protein
MNEVHSAIERRINFLLAEARSPDPLRCHGLSMLMRSITNFHAVGSLTADTGKLIKEGPVMSRRAFEKQQELGLGDKFVEATMSEHPMPLTCIWGWIVNSKDPPAVQEIDAVFRCYHNVTITNKENDKLKEDSRLRKDSKIRPFCNARERYKDIEIVDREGKPYPYFDKGDELSFFHAFFKYSPPKPIPLPKKPAPLQPRTRQ